MQWQILEKSNWMKRLQQSFPDPAWSRIALIPLYMRKNVYYLVICVTTDGRPIMIVAAAVFEIDLGLLAQKETRWTGDTVCNAQSADRMVV